MSIYPEPRYCGLICEEAMINRSFGECAMCEEHWDGQSGDHNNHYRNTAWKICNTCSRKKNLCVVCGSEISELKKTQPVRRNRKLDDR
ncbi:MAG: hypothetical protein L3J59_13130 [Methylococcaceae bacterium]|nr:hypothetical protein [Methylococcaceae bacterium]